ncbi:membrane protein [Peribacillus simplex]|nr:membrane protein [Peribacillus simplex]
MLPIENQERKQILFALLVIILYLSPLLILGENAHIRVHDNLDSNLAWYKVLSESGELFGSINAKIPQIMNGLPRNAFGSEFSIIVWLHALFPTMVAYAISQALTRFIAFFGMYILLKKHFITGRQSGWIRVGTSLAFALTPFWPSGMLSTLGMPLALWAFLNIRNKDHSWKNYLVLTLLPLYSSIVLGFFFFLVAMGLLWITDVIRRKGWNLRFFLSIVYMTFIFGLVEYRLIASFIFDSEPNSRDEYFHARLPLEWVIKLTFKNFVLGHTHVMTVHALIILPITAFALYIILIKKLWRQEKVFVLLFGLNFMLSAWYAFWFYKGWLPLTERFHTLDTFNFARFHFLRPMVIYLGFALAIKIIWEHSEFAKKTLLIFIAVQIMVLMGFNEEITNNKKPTFKEFYAESLFQDIEEHIGLPQEEYRVASIGLHPAIAQFNGFYTLDSYNNFYPLTYKHQFRQIIENELAKNKNIRIYFDEWGGRCYLFADELGKHYMFKKSSKKELDNLEINVDAFKGLGGKYIFSAIPINNAKENGLELDRIFTKKGTVWKIHLYRVI